MGKYSRIYDILRSFAKLMGWRVLVRNKLSKQTAGYITPENRTIVIGGTDSYKRKCIVLSHELIGHGVQWDSGNKKFRRYFHPYKLPNTKRNLDYITFVECDASRRGAKFLKALGFPEPEKCFEELDKNQVLSWLRPFWAKMYLKPKKKCIKRC